LKCQFEPAISGFKILRGQRTRKTDK